MALEEPLFATASEAAAWLLVEQAGPWGHSALVESRLDPQVGAELQARTKELEIKALLVKPAGRDGGGRRCFLGRSDQPAPFLDEHHIEDDRDLLALDLEALARGERPAGGRPVDAPLYLVCTNSRRDACCARLGRPVAAALDKARPGRVWECSHLGGHRFAANLVCLPDGLWFGRLSPEDALVSTAEYEAGRIDLPHLRGRSSLPPAAQAADYFVRRQADLLGVDDLLLESLEADGGEAAATLRNGGTRFHVRVRGTDADPPRAVSCREDKLERPVVWSLVALEGEPAV
jgi:hypothetical protein